MNRAALMQRIEQHFGAKVARGTDLAVLMEDICCQVYQWAQGDARAEAARQPAPALPVTVRFALSAEQKNVIRFAAEALEGLNYEDTAGDLRAILAAAAPAAPVAEPEVAEWIERICEQVKYDRRERERTGVDDKFYTFTLNEMVKLLPILTGATLTGETPEAGQPQPVAEQGELPKWIDDQKGKDPLMDDMIHYIVQLRAAIAASQQAAEPVARPNNEELQALWDESHAGHPVDFAADVLERWGGCPAGLLGNGSAPAIQQPQDERAAFEAWASAPVRASKLPLDRWATNDGYVDQRTYTAFYGWQARAGLANKVAAPADNCDVCAGTGTAFGKTCNCQKGAAHG